MINLPNILPINVVGTISGTTASGTPKDIFSLANIQNVFIINEDPLEVNLVGSGIDLSVTLQDAYDNGDGVITTTVGKPLDLQGTGRLTAVTGTFTEGLTVGTGTVVIVPLAIGVGRDNPAQCIDVVGSGTFTGDVTAQGRIGAGTLSPTTELEVIGDITSKGTSWTSRTNPVDNKLFAVTYGNGLFVAVSYDGTGNRVMTSPDGINWTTRTSAADNGWNGITYGNGLFVVIAFDTSGNQVMTSPDGITWTLRTTPTPARAWTGITYGNGTFVAVSQTQTNRVMTSPDGITWTDRSAALAFLWFGVTFGNGLFVAVSASSSSNQVMTSPDGISWTIRTTPNRKWLDVTYGNGLFVAVGETGTNDRVMTSPDGTTWTIQTSAADNSWRSVTYGNGLFVAIAETGSPNMVMTSPDGINWTSRTSTADNLWRDVTYANGMFVAVGESGASNRIMTSGKTELNEVSPNNILQGRQEMRGSFVVTGDATLSGTTVLMENLPTASGSLTAGALWVDVADNYALRITPN